MNQRTKQLLHQHQAKIQPSTPVEEVDIEDEEEEASMDEDVAKDMEEKEEQSPATTVGRPGIMLGIVGTNLSKQIM